MGAMKIRYIGTGISRDSAIFFSGVLTSSEHTKYQLAYLNSKEYMIHNKFIKENEDGFDYDIYLTQKGLVWFKQPAKHPREKAFLS